MQCKCSEIFTEELPVTD